ncbi:hypothetical protein CDJ04_06920 [Salmonella enterica]|uniref:Uncharacterized protein n=1 Tax=Salmonella enterica I TaxID=59201 RepID=A0A3R1AYG4_SALET|nr:hypothetical protein [Salmonella enterica]EBZ5136730.1 hypothetical protein [Salmonella enterica subsp. enterica serovar Antsalova]ECD5540347.1 hypothetical protein [Salmonella enterica subsp. enterica serovar Kokomlemle]ECE6544919.1 hypothetical protein [Salmonella enterica subsp. enterica]EDX6359553.1 hypothetical protein [Salmonella enterica subsp. enterica serovar Ealing]EEP4633570.1 hypothetical protein [Salmonella enterica subsp. enterica serovar Poano]EHI8598925.1 hypothetical prote
MKKDIWDILDEHLEEIVYIIVFVLMASWVVFCCWWFFIDSDLSLLSGLFLFVVLTGFLCFAFFLIGEPLGFLILVALGLVYILYKLLVMLWRGIVHVLRNYRRHDK